MEKFYVVEFEEVNGNTHTFEFLTSRIEWAIDQYCRNRHISNHRILSEKTA